MVTLAKSQKGNFQRSRNIVLTIHFLVGSMPIMVTFPLSFPTILILSRQHSLLRHNNRQAVFAYNAITAPPPPPPPKLRKRHRDSTRAEIEAEPRNPETWSRR